MEAPYFTFLADPNHLETREVAHGLAVVASRTAPEKTTPNEDNAAVIPISEDQAVLLVAGDKAIETEVSLDGSGPPR
mgnify:CR=1 FL=1